MNSKSDWLKSEAEHYQHCYQTHRECISLPVLTQMDNNSNIYCRQLHNQNPRKLDKMCQICIMLIK